MKDSKIKPQVKLGSSDSSVGKESTCNEADPGSIHGSGRSPGEGIGYPLLYSWASLVAQLVKNPPAMRETWVQSLGREDPRRRKWQPTPVFLPGESHGRRSLVGNNSQGHKESDVTEVTWHSMHISPYTCHFLYYGVLLFEILC